MERKLELIQKIVEDFYNDKSKSDSVLSSTEINYAEEFCGKFLISCEHPEELINTSDNVWDTLQSEFQKATGLILLCSKTS